MQIYTNVHVYQGNADAWADAVVVDGAGMILAVGTTEELRGRYPDSLEIDLEGGYLFPGFTDSHNHSSIICREMVAPNLSDIKTWRQAKKHIRDYINAHPSRSWYVVFGWNEERWGMLTSADLDEISTSERIFLVHSTYHEGVLNTKSLESIHSSGLRLRHQHGVVVEQDYRLAQMSALPTYDEFLTLIPRYHRELRNFGITGVHDMLLMNIDQLRAYITLDMAGLLQMETVVYLHETLLDAPEFDEYAQYEGKHLTIAGGKAFLDGAIGVHSALMHDPYSDGVGGRGLANMSAEHVLDIILKTASKGLRQFAFHAIGDAAVSRALDIIETFEREHNAPMLWRIDHAEIIRPEDMERMKQYSVTIVMQPSALIDIERYADRLGDRVGRINPFRELIDQGVSLVFGSEHNFRNPFECIELGIKHAEFDHQKITIEEGIKRFTTSAAALSRTSQFIGEIGIGKRADMFLLRHNPFTYRWGLGRLEVVQAWFAGVAQFRAIDGE